MTVGHFRAWWGALAAVVAVAAWTSEARAQDGSNFAVPSQEQFELYEAGIRAFQEGRYPASIERLQASLKLGALNITYLNLGRTYFKNGQCEEAIEAYNQVATAPQIRDPSPAQVLAKLDEYRSDLGSCPGLVEVQTQAAAVEVQVDDGPWQPLVNPLRLPAGEHTLRARRQGQDAPVAERRLVVVAAERQGAPLDLPEPAQEEPSSARLWTLAGLGAFSVASLGGGVGFYFLAQDDYERAQKLAQDGKDEAKFNSAVSDTNRDKLLSNLLYGVGFAGVGATALLWWFWDDAPEVEQARLRLILGTEGAALEGRW
jgi:tetratricopeptide (TPR) repeat protein